MPKHPDPNTPSNVLEFAEQPLPEATLRPVIPIVPARVVYLGAARNKTVSLPGRILTETYEDTDGTVHVIKTAVDEGITQYDFATHDSRGRLIRERLMPDSAAAPLRGKPWGYIEHMDHIRHFYLARGPSNEKEFEVMVKPEHQTLVQDYIRRSARARAQQEALFNDVVNG